MQTVNTCNPWEKTSLQRDSQVHSAFLSWGCFLYLSTRTWSPSGEQEPCWMAKTEMRIRVVNITGISGKPVLERNEPHIIGLWHRYRGFSEPTHKLCRHRERHRKAYRLIHSLISDKHGDSIWRSKSSKEISEVALCWEDIGTLAFPERRDLAQHLKLSIESPE